jgi:superfamily II DNA/RNA helicase
LCYHGELGSDDRAENLAMFRASSSGKGRPVFKNSRNALVDEEEGNEEEESSRLFGEETCKVLVCTDIAARGLDIPEVDHVVMFDFPLNPIDFLHRAGRTARGTKKGGKVTALVTKRDRVLAIAIETAVRKGLPIDGLSSRKSDYVGTGKTKSEAIIGADGARKVARGSGGGGNARGGGAKSNGSRNMRGGGRSDRDASSRSGGSGGSSSRPSAFDKSLSGGGGIGGRKGGSKVRRSKNR